MSYQDLSGIVVGGGSIGQRHLQNLLSIGVSSVATVEINEARRAELEDEFDISGYESLDAALATDPDFAIVAVPNHLHIPVAVEVARSGCHLLVEKPISHELDRVEELLTEVERRGLTGMVGCNILFHPGIQQVASLVEEGTIGDVLSVRIEAGSYLPEWHPERDYRDSYSAKTGEGGGAILDFIHEINYAQALFGQIGTVSGLLGSGSSLDIETEDTAALLVKFEDGTLGEIHMDYVQRRYSRSCHVIGQKGTIRWQWEDESVKWCIAGDGEWNHYRYGPDWDVNQMYIDEVRHFLDHVLDGESPRSTLRDGYEDLKVGLAAKQSATIGEHVAVGSRRDD
ncbi:Gfo/Idh/MocA family protein [Haloarchaeobius sp. DT45]|uniref:Gfo/Idh/MocA family protein n=1 Tax=Haloarchaeobius sp. DT45 TaxID=3446116 RepID=UPI003F6D0437